MFSASTRWLAFFSIPFVHWYCSIFRKYSPFRWWNPISAKNVYHQCLFDVSLFADLLIFFSPFLSFSHSLKLRTIFTQQSFCYFYVVSLTAFISTLYISCYFFFHGKSITLIQLWANIKLIENTYSVWCILYIKI